MRNSTLWWWHSDKVTEQRRCGTLKQNIVKETFKQKDLQGKVTGIETSVPALTFLQEPPTRNRIGQVFNVVFFSDSQRAHVGNNGSAPFVRFGDLPGKLLKVRVSFPNANGVANAAFPIDDEELRVFAMPLGLSSKQTENKNG